MFPSTPNLFIYIALISGIVFTIYSVFSTKKLPILTDIFSVILSVTAGYSGIELCYLILEGSKGLGDFSDQKLIIILGGISVFWVALTATINSVKQVSSRM